MALKYYPDDYIKTHLQKGRIIIAEFPEDLTSKSPKSAPKIRAVVRGEKKVDGTVHIETIYGNVPFWLCTFAVFELPNSALTYMNSV
jgi:hypothetical protein